jgi:hypothetical protein
MGPKNLTIQKVLVPLHILLADIQRTVGGVTRSNQEHSPPGVQSIRPSVLPCACEVHFDSRIIGIKEGKTMVAEGGYKNMRHMSG